MLKITVVLITATFTVQYTCSSNRQRGGGQKKEKKSTFAFIFYHFPD